MSGDSQNPKPEHTKSASSDKIEDLKDQKLSDEASGKVKGGLQPQPLPPRHR